MKRRTFLAAPLLALGLPATAQESEGQGTLNLSATLGAGPPLTSSLRWRVFTATPDADGQHRLIVELALPRPTLTVAPGDYVVHVAFGLASATKSITLSSDPLTVKLALAAGALRIHCTSSGDKPVDPADVALAVYVPERNNSTAKLVYAKAKEGEVIGVPEGNYHISSTYLDSRGVGSLGQAKNGAAIPTNSDRGRRRQRRHRQDRRRHAAPSHRDADHQARQCAGRRRARQFDLYGADAGRRHRARTRRRLPLAGAGGRRICRRRAPQRQDLPGDFHRPIRYGPRRGSAGQRRDELGGADADVLRADQMRSSARPTPSRARLAEAEIASEIYSIAGDFDILAKFYVERDVDIGHFVGEKVQCIPGIADTRTLITFRAF